MSVTMVPIVVVLPESVERKLAEFTRETIRTAPDEFLTEIDALCVKNGWTVRSLLAGNLVGRALMEWPG